MSELTAALDDERAGLVVPTCPRWTVQNVIAHVTGVVDDALAGRLDGVATDPWTAAQVDARRTTPIATVVAEWTEKAPAFEALLDPIGDAGRQAVADVVTHEHDIRLALGEPGARDSDALRIGMTFLGPGFVGAAAAHGVTAQLRVSDGATFGDPDAPVVLSGEVFELFRAMTGRRSLAQVRALDWKGDVDAVLPAFTFGPFTPSPVDIIE
jgi:uncharacterized protein (TIGR03083 family)